MVKSDIFKQDILDLEKLSSDKHNINIIFNELEQLKINKFFELFNSVVKNKYKFSEYEINKGIPFWCSFSKGGISSICSHLNIYTKNAKSIEVLGIYNTSIGYSFEETKIYNIFDDINFNEVVLQNSTDNKLKELYNLIKEINDIIYRHFTEFKNKNELYQKFKDIDTKENSIKHKMSKKVINTLTALDKKDLTKLLSIYGCSEFEFEVHHIGKRITEGYEIGIINKKDYIIDSLINFKHYKYLGDIVIKDTNEFTFEPYFKSSSILNKKVTFNRYLKNTFIKNFVKKLEE